MTPEQAIQILQQLASRATTQLNGLGEARLVADALAALEAMVSANRAKPETVPAAGSETPSPAPQGNEPSAQ